MEYDTKRVAELIDILKDHEKPRPYKVLMSGELNRALQPRLQQIIEIVSTLDHDVKVNYISVADFIIYIRHGRRTDGTPSLITFVSLGNFYGKPGLYFEYYDVTSYDDSITIPFEWATCESKDLKKCILRQIHQDTIRNLDHRSKALAEGKEANAAFENKYQEFLADDENNTPNKDN